MQDIIDKTLATGRFSKTTVLYWVDWLVTYDAVPPNHYALIDFIAGQEEYIGDTMHEAIPDDWRKD